MFGDALEWLGDTLDKPGRAVRGVLGGRPDEAAAILPFSDSLGITDKANAVSGAELSRQWTGLSPDSTEGQVTGFGLDLLTDPLTYFGGAVGRLGGKALGRGLEAAAAARGPGYATQAADLARMAAETADQGGFVKRRLSEIFDLPDKGAALMSEINPQSRILGAGAEGVAFGTPAGQVTRVGRSPIDAMGRPVSEDVLQPFRTVDYPRSAAFDQRVEHLPFAPAAPGGRPVPNDLVDRLRGQGLDFTDPNPGNWGTTTAGRPVVIDPGAVSTSEGFTGGFAAPTAPRAPDRVERLLLDLLGGQGAMRRALDAGRAAPGYERGLGLAGTAAGAAGGGLLGAF